MTEPTPVRTAADLAAWIAAAAPGDVACYHTGCLAIARGPEAPRDAAKRVGALADAAWKAKDDGLVLLTHRRLGTARWAYLATRATQQKRRVAPQRASAGRRPTGRVREAVA